MKFLAPCASLALCLAAHGMQMNDPHDIILILDTTGSTGSVLPTWKANMKVNMAFGLDQQFPGSRFAIVKHEDFPFDPYGGLPDIPYKLIVPLTPFADWDTKIQPALNAITSSVGGDNPESQYVAVTLALGGGGLDLNNDGLYTGLGEVNPADNVMGFDPNNDCIFLHFTTPDLCHDSDTDLNYPQTGTANDATPGKSDAEALYIGNPHVTFNLLIQGPLDSEGGQSPDPTPVSGGMAQLALGTGGLILGVGANLEDLKAAMVKVMINSPMRIGQNWTGQIFTVGQPANVSYIAIGTSPLTLPLSGWGTLLIGGSSYTGSSLLGPKPGPFALHQGVIPNNPALCGITLYTQGGVLQTATATVTLTNAQDLLIGTIASL
jgi:hypothetical protein